MERLTTPDGATSVMGSPRKDGATPASIRARKQRRKRLTWTVVAIAAVAAVVVWFVWFKDKGQDTSSQLYTDHAISTTIVETVSASGSVTAQTGAEVHVGSQITGTIKRLYADVGSHVQANQIIAELFLPDIQAQLGQAESNLSAAITKYQQEESGVGMEKTQTSDVVKTAMDAVKSAEASRSSALAAASQQPRQTRSDIAKAAAGINTAKAALLQAQSSHDLEIAAAQAAVDQAKANTVNNNSNLSRELQLFKQGYVAASDVDTARQAADVATAQYSASQHNLNLAKANADAALSTSEAQVAQAKAVYDSAQAETLTDVQKQQAVLNADAGLRQAQSQLSSAVAGMAQDTLKNQDVVQAREAVQTAEETVKYNQAQSDKTLIRTPISGTVLQLAAQQGETLAAGLSAPTLIIVADLNRLQVDAFVDETDIGKVKLGQDATVTVDAFPDEKFVGQVVKIASGSTLQQNVVTYDVTVAIKDPQHQLKPDMTASVTISVGNHPGVVAVVNEALKPGKTAGSYYVWLLAKGAKEPEMQTVVTGATDGTYTEIKSGLADADTVVVAGWPKAGANAFGAGMTPFGVRAGGAGGGGGGGGGGRTGGGGGGRGGG